AEDGIRDGHVTGVQTCALPISAWDAIFSKVKVKGGTDAQRTIFLSALHHAFIMPTDISDVDGGYIGQDKQPHVAAGFHYLSDMRSEERRVGKESRARCGQ